MSSTMVQASDQISLAHEGLSNLITSGATRGEKVNGSLPTRPELFTPIRCARRFRVLDCVLHSIELQGYAEV